jgi:putative nucleotidyltransferase with HDIG domain
MLQTELGRADSVLAALEKRRPDVAAHCRRVSAYAVRLAVQYGFARDVVDTIRLGALLHDVGKMLTPSRLLEKPGRPSARESRELKIHPELGMEICHRSGFDDDVCTIVLYHHERHDGQGYPDALAHPAIPVGVRIVSVMDAFDALGSPHEYRGRMSLDAARMLIARGAGTRFCPWVVSGFLALPPEMLSPRAGYAAEAGRHPEGPVLMPIEHMGDLRPPGPDAAYAFLS